MQDEKYYEISNHYGALYVWTPIKETAKQIVLERRTEEGYRREHRLDKNKLDREDIRGYWTRDPAKAWAYLAKVAKGRDLQRQKFDDRIAAGFAALSLGGYKPEVSA